MRVKVFYQLKKNKWMMVIQCHLHLQENIHQDLFLQTGQQVSIPTAWTTQVASVIKGDSIFTPRRGTKSSSWHHFSQHHYSLIADKDCRGFTANFESWDVFCLTSMSSRLGPGERAANCKRLGWQVNECRKTVYRVAPFGHLLIVFTAWKIIYWMEKSSG